MSRQSFRIVRMEHRHLDGAVEVERQCFVTPWSRDALEQELNRGDISCYVVAETEDGEVAGFAGMWTAFDQAHVTTIGVLPQYRRRHLGECMLVALIEESRRRGVKMMTLEHRAGNDAARRLYDKYGFVEDGVRRNYYDDTMEDAIVRSIPNLEDKRFLELYEDNVRRLRALVELEDGRDRTGD